jgi:hypothetical protein
LYFFVVGLYPGFDLGVENTIEVPLGGFGVELGAIVERDSLLQMKDIGPAAIQDLP